MGEAAKFDGSSQSKSERKEKRAFFLRKWTQFDIEKASAVVVVHLLCLVAPFYFKWEAISFGWILNVVTNICITFSYHRNLTHQSFKLPKLLEYLFAYSALFALQGHPIDWVSTHRFHHQFTDSDRDPHSPIEGFWFSHVLWIFDSDYIREKGVGGVFAYHLTWLVNSACHIWGSRAWNTKDTSRNVWWLGLLTFGESWHNNHHAFEASARHGLEWYQVDVTWYLIRFFQALGLATNVKLPTDAQKRKMAFAH